MNPNLFPQSTGPSPAQSKQFPDVKSAADPAKQSSGGLFGLEQRLSNLLSRPALPTSGKDMLAEYFPWLALITAFVMFPIVLTGFLNSDLLSFTSSIGTLNTNPTYWIGLVLFTMQFALVAVSIMKLLHHRHTGWKHLFLSSLLGLLTAIASIFAGFANPVVIAPVLLLVSVASLYLLCQIRSYFAE